VFCRPGSKAWKAEAGDTTGRNAGALLERLLRSLVRV